MHVFGNRVPRETLGTKGELGDWGNFMELHDVYREPNIFRVVKSKGERWTGNVA
jgi:hypothetical protein